MADCNAARVNLAADMADDSQRIKVTSCCLDSKGTTVSDVLSPYCH